MTRLGAEPWQKLSPVKCHLSFFLFLFLNIHFQKPKCYPRLYFPPVFLSLCGFCERLLRQRLTRSHSWLLLGQARASRAWKNCSRVTSASLWCAVKLQSGSAPLPSSPRVQSQLLFLEACVHGGSGDPRRASAPDDVQLEVKRCWLNKQNFTHGNVWAFRPPHLQLYLLFKYKKINGAKATWK